MITFFKSIWYQLETFWLQIQCDEGNKKKMVEFYKNMTELLFFIINSK